MAISLVGSAISNTGIDGSDVTLDLTTIATLAENDVVYVLCAVPRVAVGAGTSSSGWTSISGPHDNTVVRTQVFRKVMGATPDTSFVCTGTANAADGTIAVAIGLRGVDTTTPEDATPVARADTASTNPDASAIVTVTDDAWVVVFAGSGVNDAAITIPTGYSNGHSNTVSDTRSISGSVATKLVATAASEDPASWTAWASGRWGAYSIAVRPSGAAPAVFVGATTITFSQTGALQAGAIFAAANTITFSQTGDFVAGGSAAAIPDTATQRSGGAGSKARFARYWKSKYAGYFNDIEWTEWLLAYLSNEITEVATETKEQAPPASGPIIIEPEPYVSPIIGKESFAAILELKLDTIMALAQQRHSERVAALAEAALYKKRRKEDEDDIETLLSLLLVH